MDRSHWIEIRKKLLLHLKDQVRAQMGGMDQELSSYESEFKKEFDGNWWPEDKNSFIEAVVTSDVVIAGDFHPFAQSQRTHLRILRSLPENQKWVLALECFEKKDQKYVDQYMNGQLDELSFLSKIEWEDRWSFPWKNYLPLIKLAKNKNIPVVGVNEYYSYNEEDTLNKRDIDVAEHLDQIYESYPDHNVFVLIGNLHLAEGHLLAKLKKRRPDLKYTRVFQNAENLYFQLAEKGLESQVDILQSDKDKYCLFTSPPWVKWQSYLIYLEQTYDYEIDFEGEEEDDEEFWESVDYTDQIKNLVQFIETDLKIKVEKDTLSVYSAGDDEIWDSLRSNVEQKEIFDQLVKNARSFYIPHTGQMYLSRTTINHAASVAGHFIQAALSGRDRLLWRMPHDFRKMIWEETVAYFLSKLINHKRKTMTIKDLQVQLSSTHPDDKGKEALMLSMEQKFSELMADQTGELKDLRVQPKDFYSYIESARILGPMLGEKLYISYRAAKYSPEKLLDILSFSVDSEKFDDFYLERVRELNQVEVPKIFKEFKLS